MGLKKNISVNYLGTIWNIFSIYFFLPLYLKYLDSEAFGLVMFITTIQSIVSLLDVGFSSAIRRKLSWRTLDKGYQIESISFLRGVEGFYILILVLVSVVVFFFTSILNFNWFIIKSMTKTHVDICINLLVISASLQLFVSLYHGGLQSRERQTDATLLQFIYTLLKNGFVVVLIFFFPNPIVFIGWQLLVVLLFVFVYRNRLLNELNPSHEIHISSGIINRVKLFEIFKATFPFFALSLLSTINFEIDKILISKLLNIKLFGVYGLVFSLAQASVTICSPLSTAIAPRLINSYFNNDIGEVSKLFHQFSKLATIISITTSGILLLFSNEVLFLWTKDSSLVSEARSFNLYLIFAGVFLASQVIPYQLGIASLSFKHVLYSCVINIIITTPLYYFMILSFGLTGCAIVWLSSNIIMALVNNYFYIQKVLKDAYLKWLFIDFLAVGLLSIFNLFLLKLIIFDLFKFEFGIFSLLLLSVIAFTANMLVIFFKFKL